jgi:hypothetical protein
MKKNNVLLLILTAVCLAPAPALAAGASLDARRTEEAMVIDGRLDEPAWETAPSVGDFIQFTPNNGEPASLKTIAKILYDDDYVYVGFINHDPEPHLIQLGAGKRDGLSAGGGTDSVTVSLDTFNDDQTEYYFRTNIQGVQHDGRVSDNGRAPDTKWDGVYLSAGARIEEGWSAEMAIPLSTLKFPPGENRTWGVQFSRYIPRNLEQSFWPEPLEDYRKISNAADLTGLNLKASGKRLELIPHVISRLEEGEENGYEGGLDARYSFSQLVSGHLTVNPDFATVEADEEQVNLTRFELNLPEKRNFFLEDTQVYNQRIRLFYSRRIADIYGGGKLYGKTGGLEFSALSAQTKEDDGEGSSANFSVLRLKRDVAGSSTIGFLAANKLVDGLSQGSLGFDTALYFSDTFSFTGQLAASYGDGEPTDYAFFVRPSYDTSTFHTHLRYTFLGDRFGDNANAVGFIRDDNRRELDSDITKTFWITRGSVERIDYRSNYNVYWGVDDTLRSWEGYQSLGVDFRNKLGLRVRHDREYKLYEKDFFNYSSTVEVGYNTREYQSARLAYRLGKNFDSDFTLLSGIVKRKLTEELSVEYELTKLSLSPDPENESTWIHIIRGNQTFNKDLFVSFFYQLNSVIDKRNIQAVFVYRFQPPFGLFQVAYQRGTARFGEAGTQGHTLFLKLAYVF